MGLEEWLKSPFRFNAIPVSILAFVLYGGVFTAVLVADQTAGVPKDLGGFDLDQAYIDLHRITARPHPYISHANDEVHEYLLDRLRPIIDSQPYIELSDDSTSNASYVTERGAMYFEGTNVLVRVEGTDARSLESDAVLFSAHYDSVSTAPGATDDGMSIVTLLQMVKYLADPKRRPRRTAMFLFNNGEEDGFNGARVFFEHPWSNQTAAFINLEGAAAGGRPMLFRATSLSAARSLRESSIKHPHGNVLSADTFALGVVRSHTDYEVYARGIKGEKAGLSGIDLAFYKNRAFYHTPLDSIPGMGRKEPRKSLWAMMESVRGAGLAMLNGDDSEGVQTDGDTGVYFDVLYRVMVAFSLRGLFITNVGLLILGPLVIVGLFTLIVILSKKNSAVGPQETERSDSANSRHHRSATVIGWAKFWVALFLVIGLNIALVACYVKINPFIAHSRPYLVLSSFLLLSFLGISCSLSLIDGFWPSPPSSLKGAIVLELYLLTWIFMVFATVAVNNLHIGGVYLITVWHLCAWMAAIITVAEAAARAGRSGQAGAKGAFDLIEEEAEEFSGGGEEQRHIRGVMYDAPEQEGVEGEEVETEPTEITPLMQQHRRRSTSGREYVVGVDNEPLLVNNGTPKTDPGYEEFGWWIFQMFILIPLPTLLLFQVAVMVQHSLRSTMVDGSSPITVYAGIAALSILLFINLAPFAHRIHGALHLISLLILVVVLAVAWSSFPFTQEAPLKVVFQQSVELDLSDQSSSQGSGKLYLNPTRFLSGSAASAPQVSVLSVKTLLAGLRGFVDKGAVAELPSSWGKDVQCEVDDAVWKAKGLWTCTWDSGLLPSPSGPLQSGFATTPAEWFTFQTERLNASSARFKIKGTNTRSCALYFDSPVRHFYVHGSRDRFQPGYGVPEEGVKELMLWSRTWEKEFVVDVRWDVEDDSITFKGRAGCEWAEYASGTAGGPHVSVSAQIPAFEEVLHFLPWWIVPTKRSYGLVEAWTKFSV